MHTNQIVLVTGGGTGIGAATALAFARAGAHVVITGRTEATLATSAAQHPAISYVVADAGDPAAAERAMREVIARHDRLDILVNNAAVCEIAPLAQLDLAHVRRMFDTNVLGLIETTRLALPHLERSRGTIVNLASTVADHPPAGMSAYSATKAAVLCLTRTWAQELAPAGIRVNAVSPGPIDTPAYQPEKMRVPAEVIEQLGAMIATKVPLGRFGTAAETAAVVLFLASSAASYVTGAEYVVGGGMGL